MFDAVVERSAFGRLVNRHSNEVTKDRLATMA